MSKEMLKQADDWLKSMYDLLSLKTDNEDREYTQNKIDLFEWLIKQAEHNLVLQERLSKRGRQISGLKNALQRNRGAREKAEWNELVQRGVSDLSVRLNSKLGGINVKEVVSRVKTNKLHCSNVLCKKKINKGSQALFLIKKGKFKGCYCVVCGDVDSIIQEEKHAEAYDAAMYGEN